MCRALENTIYFAGVNYAFALQESASCVFDPTGDCLGYQPYGQAGVLVVDVDPAQATRRLALRYNASACSPGSTRTQLIGIDPSDSYRFQKFQFHDCRNDRLAGRLAQNFSRQIFFSQNNAVFGLKQRGMNDGVLELLPEELVLPELFPRLFHDGVIDERGLYALCVVRFLAKLTPPAPVKAKSDADKAETLRTNGRLRPATVIEPAE